MGFKPLISSTRIMTTQLIFAFSYFNNWTNFRVIYFFNWESCTGYFVRGFQNHVMLICMNFLYVPLLFIWMDSWNKLGEWFLFGILALNFKFRKFEGEVVAVVSFVAGIILSTFQIVVYNIMFSQLNLQLKDIFFWKKDYPSSIFSWR